MPQISPLAMTIKNAGRKPMLTKTINKKFQHAPGAFNALPLTTVANQHYLT
jgi:hypothetical protein